MALVSPGIQISINDQSQFVSNAVGSVPLLVLATAQDKTYNGSIASGTTKANAGKLLGFTSQRDLVTQMGTPSFQIGASGTPVNGSEINEYGLMTAYSALGLGNQLFAIRADVDLAQLAGTAVRPVGAPVNGTDWLDLANTEWGIYQSGYDSNGIGTFTHIDPILITDGAQVNDTTLEGVDVSVPVSTIGNIGDYALVFVDENSDTVERIRLYFKAGTFEFTNEWVLVGSVDWQRNVPVATGTIESPTIATLSTLTINTVTVTTSAIETTVVALANSINSFSIPGVFATVTSTGKLQLLVTDDATSNGADVDGKAIVTDGTNTPLADAGISVGTYFAPILFYGNYAQQPAGGWFTSANDSEPRPAGSIWHKTSATGGGLDIVLKQYNSSVGAFEPKTVPAFAFNSGALYGLDPIGGGVNIEHGQVYFDYGSTDALKNSYRFFEQLPRSVTIATGGTPTTINASHEVQILVSTPGNPLLDTLFNIPMSGTTAASFVNDLISAQMPYVDVALNVNGTITITHTLGGQIVLINRFSGTAVQDAGFRSGVGSGFSVASNTNVTISNWDAITTSIDYSTSQPYSAPESGTYWYYSNPADIDILINDNGWKGYQNVTLDARGFDLSDTDANGVIISATRPTSQTNGDTLVRGDLWLDSSDLVNFPVLYRCTAVVSNTPTWTLIDTTDHITSGGIIFADARWDGDANDDTGGTTDVISGNFPAITDLLTSDYIDLDAPDYRLYPRGTLLFNTRRGGYNVKKFVPDYFNATSYPDSDLPSVKDTWVSVSGVDSNGVMKSGKSAQRAVVVAAMQSAVDSNIDVLSAIYQFNLIATPGYPELIPNMITLNDNRGGTAFIIGDTPMDLAPNSIEISNWVNNVDGSGLSSNASANAYLGLYYPAGRTNDLAGNTIVVPASHAVLRTFLYNDQVAYPWFAPAGTHRGLVSNFNDIGYLDAVTGQFVHNSINQGLRDALYNLAVNPITQLPGTGLVVWGQLTRSGSSTARNRVNVVRLENYLRTILNSIANGYLFEPNDTVTRKSIASQIESALNNVLSLRGLYDFLVICDTSNNTPSTIANNQLYVDIAIEPMRDVEFIYIPIAIYNPGSIAALNTAST